MRNCVIDRITKLAEADERIMILTGDLGYSVLEGFAEKYPERYINAGIAEADMTGVAAGLAIEGNIVFTYSIGNFPTLRCMEQIRNLVCYHNCNVKIIATGGGFAYGSLGMTHHATEDLAAMRALPGMKVFSPAGISEALGCLEMMYKTEGPAYLRLARGEEESCQEDGAPDVMHLIRKNADTEGEIAILTTGTVLEEGRQACNMLKEREIYAELYSVPAVKPLDRDGIRNLAVHMKLLVTVEEHNIVGGFGGAVSEVVAEMSGNRAKVLRIGLNDTYTSVVGSQDYLRKYYGISGESIYKRIRAIWETVD